MTALHPICWPTFAVHLTHCLICWKPTLLQDVELAILKHMQEDWHTSTGSAVQETQTCLLQRTLLGSTEATTLSYGYQSNPPPGPACLDFKGKGKAETLAWRLQWEPERPAFQPGHQG